MLYIPCVEFQFCIHYIQLPLEKKMANLMYKGGQDSGKGGQMPPPAPPLNETLLNIHVIGLTKVGICRCHTVIGLPKGVCM